MLRRNISTVAVVAMLALTQQACSNGSEPVEEPATQAAAPASATPVPASASATVDAEPSATAAGGTAGGDPILAGKRQVVIKPIETSESIVVLEKGKLTTTDGEAEHSLFVFTPHNGKYLIKTAKAGAGGEPSCLGIKGNGSNPLTVVVAACDTSRAGQLFTVEPVGKKDGEGRPIYSIRNGDAFLQLSDRYGVIAEELGDAPLATTYALVDNGPSTLPALD
ncbi:hypothetical protein FHR83_009148 [Actinoplanes campanulatus]|uniref:Ricin-type beta-trefoil lectin domain-like n=1 Tax=Actinoplanes campanulatus TaxID=113559 RepID=A0A7W5AT90_9ACTN|nr:hypothetical protein [Actinoplanes campanulatus]MBB3101419.1 hypothetical protein [Actinoplanes campanulatus]GGN50490.1 hypothetical protein GCM10010109_89690 [Actinoplanes campanulatus]GID42519.1 hypothetical protein Aca09nite_90250 [Actinoplanes campanulatus]